MNGEYEVLGLVNIRYAIALKRVFVASSLRDEEMGEWLLTISERYLLDR